jgi:hypothetical protein
MGVPSNRGDASCLTPNFVFSPESHQESKPKPGSFGNLDQAAFKTLWQALVAELKKSLFFMHLLTWKFVSTIFCQVLGL